MHDRAEIYVLGEGRGPKKIGASHDARIRHQALQTASSKPIRLLHSVPVDPAQRDAIESHAHWLLRDAWVKGEWFAVGLEQAKRAISEAVVAVAQGRAERGQRRVGRRQVNFDSMMARFPEHTFARIDRMLKEGETRSDVLRKALEAELKRREKP